jgi:putative hydroxymethylpyrimidine transport system substrate-binding protein
MPRLALTLLLLTTALLAGCGSEDDERAGGAGPAAKPLTPIEFQLSWLPGGDNLGFWAGKEKGFFEEEGIDLQIRHSNDPTASIKLAASGERPLAIAYTGDILFSAAKGEKVTSIFSLTDSSPFGIISLDESGIGTPKDLEGKRVGVTSLPIDQAFFDNMLEEAGVDRSAVKVVDPGQSGVQQLLQGNLDATSAIVDYEPAVLESKGKTDYTFTFYSDYGAPDAPFYCIVANPEWLAQNGETARAFVRAVRRSFAWTHEHVDEAADIFMEEFPEQDRELVKTIWTREREIQGDGTNDPAKFRELARFLEAEGLLESPVGTSELATNDYL